MVGLLDVWYAGTLKRTLTGYESACTTFLAIFPRVRPTGDELTVFCISVKSWLVLETILQLNEE